MVNDMGLNDKSIVTVLGKQVPVVFVEDLNKAAVGQRNEWGSLVSKYPDLVSDEWENLCDRVWVPLSNHNKICKNNSFSLF